MARMNQQERTAGLLPIAWPCNTLGNHDCTRVFSHFDDGKHGSEWARLNLALMLTLRGTPFLYNGEEIGMTDTLLDDLSLFRDSFALWVYQVEQDVMGNSVEEVLRTAAVNGQDKCRTPMHWRNAINGGFCPEGVRPWLPVNPNYAAGINVEDQRKDPDSLLNFYRTLLAVSRKTPALVEGDYQPLLEDQQDVFAFLRKVNGQTCLVLLNMSEHMQKASIQKGGQRVQLIYSNRSRLSSVDSLAEIALKPFEVYIAEIE